MRVHDQEESDDSVESDSDSSIEMKEEKEDDGYHGLGLN